MSPATTIVRTKALTPPRRSLRNTPTDSAPPTPWMIQASVPRKAHVVAKDEVSGASAPMVIGVAGSTPPASAMSDMTTKTPVRTSTAVAPTDVIVPIHLAPFVDTQVATAKITIDSPVIAHGDIVCSSPVTRYEVKTSTSGSRDAKKKRFTNQ